MEIHKTIVSIICDGVLRKRIVIILYLSNVILNHIVSIQEGVGIILKRQKEKCQNHIRVNIKLVHLRNQSFVIIIMVSLKSILS